MLEYVAVFGQASMFRQAATFRGAKAHQASAYLVSLLLRLENTARVNISILELTQYIARRSPLKTSNG